MAPTLSRRSSQQMDPDHPVMSRSNSTNSISEQRIRPKSRGSTTSLQSVGVGNAFQPAQHEQEQAVVADQAGTYMQPAAQQIHPIYTQRSRDAIVFHHPSQPQVGSVPPHAQPILEHNLISMQSQHEMRPLSGHGFTDHPSFQMGYPNGMPGYHVQPPPVAHMRHHSEHYEGSPAPEDSNNENGGAKRKKGSASTVANDQELRRLLIQYNGKSLKDVATEVQRNEGTGGKSEKAKQVFAMLWLQQNCQRSTNSVRRDKVFARYTSRCGNERVPTLNPASFGKLVRIIFPNVQTRRLGVRGESKYHYVDLSLVADDEQSDTNPIERADTVGGIVAPRPGSSTASNKAFSAHGGARSETVGPVEKDVETADFPAPAAACIPIPEDLKAVDPTTVFTVDKMDCKFLNTPIIRISTSQMSQSLINSLPSLRQKLPGTMATYLAMPSENSLSPAVPSFQDTPIELPDIHQYLTDTSHDAHIAQLLHDLYRSYCIDVIDAFRKCKEKSFFNHHSAFNGKMTVPVSKLFTMACVAPWIQECDKRMYQQIVRFLAPLVQQDVPPEVWNVFERISKRLVSHLVQAFDEKCPVHVVVAKIVPAARFATLLKKLRGANTAALQLSHMLENPESGPETRTQMWLDALVNVNPDTVLEDSNPPPESLNSVKGILKTDLRKLLDPANDALVDAAEADAESSLADLLSDPSYFPGLLSRTDLAISLLSNWIKWLEKLSIAFQGHHPQCMMDWHSRFWRSMIGQIGEGTARSYGAWWQLENFAIHMLGYMTQMEGLLLSTNEQQLQDEKEVDKKKQHEKLADALGKRKRDLHDGSNGEARARSQISRSPNGNSLGISTMKHSETVDEHDAEMDELRRGGPLDLPTFRTGFSSPLKPSQSTHHIRSHHVPDTHIDDSGIGLVDEQTDGSVDPDALEAEKEAMKINKRDWFIMSSDPVEAPATASGVGVTA